MKKLLLASLLAMGISAPAHAEFVITSIDPGDADPTLSTGGLNEFKDELQAEGIDIFFKTVGLSLTEGATIEFFSYASESGFQNKFDAAGGSVSFAEAGTGAGNDLRVGATPPVPFPGTLISSAVYGGGAITDFFFEVLAGNGGAAVAGCGGTDRCGLNTQAFGIYAFGMAEFIALDMAMDGVPTSFNAGDTVVLAFDDDGAGPDDNHDDLIIVARISSVIPEPATWGLMILGFAGLATASRRRVAQA